MSKLSIEYGKDIVKRPKSKGKLHSGVSAGKGKNE